MHAVWALKVMTSSKLFFLKFYFPFIIYIFLKVEETITFAKLMESTGIVALGVHGR